MHAPFTKSSRLFFQHGESRQRPVQNPRAASVHGDEPLRIILEGIVEEPSVEITLKSGYTMVVEILLRTMDAFQEW